MLGPMLQRTTFSNTQHLFNMDAWIKCETQKKKKIWNSRRREYLFLFLHETAGRDISHGVIWASWQQGINLHNPSAGPESQGRGAYIFLETKNPPCLNSRHRHKKAKIKIFLCPSDSQWHDTVKDYYILGKVADSNPYFTYNFPFFIWTQVYNKSSFFRVKRILQSWQCLSFMKTKYIDL